MADRETASSPHCCEGYEHRMILENEKSDGKQIGLEINYHGTKPILGFSDL